MAFVGYSLHIWDGFIWRMGVEKLRTSPELLIIEHTWHHSECIDSEGIVSLIYSQSAVHSISTIALNGKSKTATQVRALKISLASQGHSSWDKLLTGFTPGTCVIYTSFIGTKSL
jgi:hypothetical protein